MAVDYASVADKESACYKAIGRVINDFVKFLLTGADALPLKKEYLLIGLFPFRRRKFLHVFNT